ncbi:hypothetical protein [uncultured Parabacteroides sp.]|uniref:hypothetical protein n=1 Tax=uncultured Parabacteroides sp. TaxID=512312 RepID=UPI0026585CBC|nr:hypothetical protein [uncultured Parabacteroides sp.]
MNDEASLNYLQKTREEYYLSGNESEKNRIGATLRSWAKNLDNEHYIELNDGAASGLFRHGRVKADSDNSIEILSNKIQNRTNHEE